MAQAELFPDPKPERDQAMMVLYLERIRDITVIPDDKVEDLEFLRVACSLANIHATAALLPQFPPPSPTFADIGDCPYGDRCLTFTRCVDRGHCGALPVSAASR
jgi:hypothetical protein